MSDIREIVSDEAVVHTPSLKQSPSFVVTIDDVNRWLDELEVVVQPDYYSGLHQASEPRKCRLSDYLDPANKSKELCPEMALPRRFLDEIHVSSTDESIVDTKAIVYVHAGRPGNFAPIHFDWDHRWLVHCCVTGSKRLVLLPPEAGWLLSPVINTSALLLPKFSEPDRRALLEKLGGTEVRLNAGDAAVFPSLYWHGGNYDEAGLSVSVHFERDVRGRPLAALPRSWWLQRLVAPWLVDGYPEELQGIVESLLRNFFAPCDEWTERYTRMNDRYRALLIERGEHAGAHALTSEDFTAELSIAREELEDNYAIEALPTQKDDSVLDAVQQYIFEGFSKIDPDLARMISWYAHTVRVGLEPKRGLVRVSHEKGRILHGA